MTHHFRLACYWLARDTLVSVFDALEPAGAVRVVGGAVRNAIMGEPLGDIDLCTDAPPDRVAQAARAAGLTVHETGLDHGTLTVVAGGEAFEVTTLREDVATDGRRATVRFTTDFARDARRRDFTINALYLDRHGNGVDFVGGYADCLSRKVRFIGDPSARILEDHLRIFRFFRFHAAYGVGPPDPSALAACRRHRRTIANLSAERVRHELSRLVMAKGAPEMVDVLAAADMLAPFDVSPLNAAAFRSLARLERAAGRSVTPALAFAALVSFERARLERFATTFKLTKRELARGLAALEAAQAMPPRSARGTRAILYTHGAEAFADGALVAAASGADVVDLLHLLSTARTWQRPRLPVTGRDLLACGAEPGPQLGARLKRLERLWIDSDFTLDRSSLLALDDKHPKPA